MQAQPQARGSATTRSSLCEPPQQMSRRLSTAPQELTLGSAGPLRPLTSVREHLTRWVLHARILSSQRAVLKLEGTSGRRDATKRHAVGMNTGVFWSARRQKNYNVRPRANGQNPCALGGKPIAQSNPEYWRIDPMARRSPAEQRDRHHTQTHKW